MHALTPREAVAVFSKVYHHRSTFAKVLIEDPALHALNLVELIQWLGLTAKHLERSLCSRCVSLETQKRLFSLLQKKMQKDDIYLLLFTAVGSFNDKILPRYLIRSAFDLQQRRGMQIPRAFQARKRVSIKTKEDADKLVVFLARIPFIPWKMAKDGCYVRVDFVGQILLQSSIESSNLFKQYAFGNFCYRSEQNELCRWGYHVAIGVKLPSGTVRILDPFFNRSTSLSVNEWLKGFCNYNPRITLELRKNKVYPKNNAVLIRVGLQHEAVRLKGKISISSLSTLDRSDHIWTMAQFKLLEIACQYSWLQDSLSLLLPVIEGEWDDKIPSAAIITYRAFERLRDFIKAPATSLLIPAFAIDAIDAQILAKLGDVFVQWFREHLIRYKEHIGRLPLAQKDKNKLRSSIVLKLFELRN